MRITLESGTCHVSWFFYDYERPPYVPNHVFAWGDPVERVMNRMLDHERVFEAADSPRGTYVSFEYESIDELVKLSEKDRRWAKRTFRQYLEEELAEEARLIQDKKWKEEAEELDDLVDRALGD